MPGTSGLAWYLDPIDGTTNFLYGLPLWSTSVGVTDDEGAVAGAVFVPVTGELFAAARGAGATRNGEPIRASGEVDATLALVATGFGYLPTRRAEQARRLATMMEKIRDIRRGGSAAVDLCYTAAGMVDAYFEDGLNSWDVVAGELIAREAGCRTGDFAGGPATPAELLVAPPQLFDQLRRCSPPADPEFEAVRRAGKPDRRVRFTTPPTSRSPSSSTAARKRSSTAVVAATRWRSPSISCTPTAPTASRWRQRSAVSAMPSTRHRDTRAGGDANDRHQVGTDPVQ